MKKCIRIVAVITVMASAGLHSAYAQTVDGVTQVDPGFANAQNNVPNVNANPGINNSMGAGGGAPCNPQGGTGCTTNNVTPGTNTTNTGVGNGYNASVNGTATNNGLVGANVRTSATMPVAAGGMNLGTGAGKAR